LPQHPLPTGHRFSWRVPLYEIDIGQAVYHGNYYHFFEMAREALLQQQGFGYPELVARQMHLAVVEAHCRYRQPVRYNDDIEIYTTITALKSRSITFHQQLFLAAAGRLATEVQLTTVCISFAGKPVPLPPELRQCLAELLVSPGETTPA
ncbi:MAG: acyl-CoA thioesterase, partial [Desulfobacca sp.]|uniref:acyl-CoA thioesterase n=1 Tax=Desulfobacca sp. TaxID=2067990 RepID=UPI00404AE0B9